jgi:hypothetical protein
MLRPIIKKVKVSRRALEKLVKKGVGRSSRIKDKAYEIAIKRVRRAKSQAVSKFNKHPVTQEIEEGPNAFNKSRTIVGRGNLFSFIGFFEGSRPTNIVREYLESSSRVYRNSKFVNSVASQSFNFRVELPSLDKIKRFTPLPWESGRSWVVGIERGISGIGNYMYGRFSDSRSGSAIQSKSDGGFGLFKKTRYMSEIIAEFRAKVTGRMIRR